MNWSPRYSLLRLREMLDAPPLCQAIKQYPNTAEPYRTLSMLYHELGQIRKAINAMTVAAALAPKNTGLWRSLAAMSLEAGMRGCVQEPPVTFC